MLAFLVLAVSSGLVTPPRLGQRPADVPAMRLAQPEAPGPRLAGGQRAEVAAMRLVQPEMPGPRYQAVVRILQIEADRFLQAIELNVAKLQMESRGEASAIVDVAAPTPEEIVEELEARRPIIRWGVTQWLKQAMGINKYGAWCPTLRKWNLHPWQWVPNEHPTLTTPKLGAALRTLRPQLTTEVRRGLTTSPLRVCRLAYRAIVVYVLAALSHLPGPQRAMIQRVWPKTLEDLAHTIEINHATALSRIRDESQGDRRVLEATSRRVLLPLPVQPPRRERLRSAVPLADRLAFWRRLDWEAWRADEQVRRLEGQVRARRDARRVREADEEVRRLSEAWQR